MLKDHAAFAVVATADPERARAFYSGTLGLDIETNGMAGVMVFTTGTTRLVVYPSSFAGTNKANAAVWGVGDAFDGIIAELEARHVVFERYPDLPETTLEGNVHRSGDVKLAWFKDPDGNLLHINNM